MPRETWPKWHYVLLKIVFTCINGVKDQCLTSERLQISREFGDFSKTVYDRPRSMSWLFLKMLKCRNEVSYFLRRIYTQNESKFKESVIKYNNPTTLFNFFKPNTTSKFKIVCFVFESKNKLLEYLHEFQFVITAFIIHHIFSLARDWSKHFTWLKAMLHEAIFLAICNATNVALQVASKTSRVTPHFATAIVALRVARKGERPSPFRNVARQVACV